MAQPPAAGRGPDGPAAPAWEDLEAAARLLGDDLLASCAGPGEPTLVVSAVRLAELARFLRDQRGFQLLRSVTAVDYYPAEPRFQLVAHFTALAPALLHGLPASPDGPSARLLRVKVPLPGAQPVVDSLVDVYPTADWHEREVYDMFGIEFAGHPDLRRILLPDGYHGHPLRKDHPLRYEEVAFSHNRERVHGSKPRAER